MEKGIGVGYLVTHKTRPNLKMVVITDKPSEHGVKWYECRWYNEKSGRFEKDWFQSSEIELCE